MRLVEWFSPAAWMARVRTAYRAMRHRAAVERDMRDEFEHHLAARADDLVRQGLDPAEARDRARREFGHAGTYRMQAREAMGLASFAEFRLSLLDVKLGLRMLGKHPVLNLAAVFALAVGIPVGLAPSHLARALTAPLPLDTEDRVRGIRYWDPASSGVAPTWDGDFAHWSASLRSFSALAALRASTYNLAVGDAPAVPASGAEVTERALGLAGGRAVIGRMLDPGDFEAGAPEVVVLGHDVWSSRFGRDPGVLGTTVRIGGVLNTVVGVMPAGFRFPANESLWMPLRVASTGGVGERTRVEVFGRLADGIDMAQAQAELQAAGVAPLATSSEATERARLRPEVVPFGLLFLGLPADGLAGLPEYRLVQVLMFALLLVACANVAMLIFARTATRLRELAIRAALGASRARIVSQVMVETLVLALLAAGLGLVVFDQLLGRMNLAAIAGAPALPYWLSLRLTSATVLGALGLAALSAAVAGAIPAIAITGRAVSRNLAGASRMRFGRLTGALMVADIAVAVAAVGLALGVSGRATDLEAADRATGIPAAEYLAVSIRLPGDARSMRDDGEAARARERLAASQRALVAALEQEPGVRRVAVGDALPRMEHRSRPYEVDDAGRVAGARLSWTRQVRVDVGFLDALGVRVRQGRDFSRTDVEGGARVAIVNAAFVDRALGGADPIGRRVRFPVPDDTAAAAWHEIVGVVGPLGVNVLNAERGEAVYLPAAPGTINPMQLAVHATVSPATLIARVREVAAGIDRDLVMGRAAVLTEERQGDWYLVMGIAAGLLVLVGVLIALATSGLYAMLSLGVTERTREIGIRAALGAPRRALVATMLRRSLVQLVLGALLGLPIAWRMAFELSGPDGGAGSVGGSLLTALGLALGVVAVVGLCSCLVPTRRILAVQAREAMRADG